jgi:hypothetical protein
MVKKIIYFKIQKLNQKNVKEEYLQLIFTSSPTVPNTGFFFFFFFAALGLEVRPYILSHYPSQTGFES